MFFLFYQVLLGDSVQRKIRNAVFFILPNNETPKNEIQPRLRFTRAWQLKYIRRFGHREGRQRGGGAGRHLVSPKKPAFCLPFMTAVMTDDCVHFLYNSSWKFHQLAAGKLLSGQPVRYGKAGGTARSSQYKSHLPGLCPPPAQLSRASCRASPPW